MNKINFDLACGDRFIEVETLMNCTFLLTRPNQPGREIGPLRSNLPIGRQRTGKIQRLIK